MNRLQIESLLKEVSEGRTGVSDALDRLQATFPLKTLALPRSIIIARCAPACLK